VPTSSEVQKRVAAIRADDTHGASWLAREALRTVRLAAEQATDRDRVQVLAEVRAVLAALRDSRPGMTPVRVWVERLGREIDRLADRIDDAAALRAAVLRAADDLIERSEQAGAAAARNAVERLTVGSVVFTASDSGTIREALRLAHRQGKLRRALVAASTAANGRGYGRELAEALAAEGLPVEVIADAAAPGRVAEANCVWLGADSVLRDGSVLNGTPSLAIARAARTARRPVEVIAESAKIDDETNPETVVVPPGMDRVPGELIAAAVTENGVASPPRPLSNGVGEVESGPPLPLGEGWGEGEVSPSALVARIAERLVARGERVAVVESAAGGRTCDLLSERPGSSAWFAGGMVAYANQSKERIAGVPAATIAQSGTVSAETALAMADGARRLFQTEWGVGETGVAGPQTGRRSAKPAGLAYVAVVGPGGQGRVVEVNTRADDRAANKHAFAMAALALLVEALSE
jgi:PncC family amidohydrolase